MPVSRRTAAELGAIGIPQARVLAVLMPADPSLPKTEWPLLNRVYLGKALGFRPTSGSLTRVLNGIRPGNTTSGKPGPGLLALGLVEVFMVYLDSCEEVNYRATAAGVRAYEAYRARGGRLPKVKDATACTNGRYRR